MCVRIKNLKKYANFIYVYTNFIYVYKKIGNTYVYKLCIGVYKVYIRVYKLCIRVYKVCICTYAKLAYVHIKQKTEKKRKQKVRNKMESLELCRHIFSSITVGVLKRPISFVPCQCDPVRAYFNSRLTLRLSTWLIKA